MKEYNAKERAVFEAVLRLAGQGVDLASLKVQQIADEAGMGKGTLYEYFKSKDEILQGTIVCCLADELRQVTELTAGVQTMDQLMQRGADYIDGLVEQRIEAYRILAEVLKNNTPADEQAGSQFIYQQVQQMLDEDYAMARATGWLAEDVDLDYFRYAVFSAMVSYAMTLASLAHLHTLTPQEKARCRAYFVRSMEGCLRG